MARQRKGSIIKRDGKIYARVQFVDDLGKKRDLCRKANSEKEARKNVRDLLKEIENKSSKELDATNMTFADLADYYIKNYLHEAVYVNEMKVSGVRGRVEALSEVKPLQVYFGNRKIQQITYGDIRNYKNERLRTPTKQGNQRAIASVNKELGKLRRMLNIAVREQWLPRNPFSNGESLISTEIPRTRILNFDEEQRLLTAIESNPYRKHLKGIVIVALDCALRRGEIFTLKWSDIDLDNRTITVRAFNSKTSRKRTVAMTNRVHNMICSVWEKSSKNPDDLVFGVSVTIKTSWKKVCREAGIDDFHFHDCRATSISRMIRAGMPPAEVMRVSGHTTLRAFSVYVRTDMDTAYRAASALDTFYATTNPYMELSQAVN